MTAQEIDVILTKCSKDIWMRHHTEKFLDSPSGKPILDYSNRIINAAINKIYGSDPTQEEIDHFLKSECKLSIEEESALEKARQQLPSSLKQVSLRIKAEQERDLLVETFKHTHINNGKNDLCKYCDLDLRHEIHTRLNTTSNTASPAPSSQNPVLKSTHPLQ